MKPGGSLPHWQEHTSCSYPEPDQSSPIRVPHPTTYVNINKTSVRPHSELYSVSLSQYRRIFYPNRINWLILRVTEQRGWWFSNAVSFAGGPSSYIGSETDHSGVLDAFPQSFQENSAIEGQIRPRPLTPFINSLHTISLSAPGSVVGITPGYGLDGPGIESRWGQDFPYLSILALRPTQPPVQRVQGLSWGVKSGRGVTLTPHPF